MLLLSLKYPLNWQIEKNPATFKLSHEMLPLYLKVQIEKISFFFNLHRDLPSKKKVKIYKALWFTKQQSWQISFCAVFYVNCSQWKYFTTVAIISASYKILQQDQNNFCTDESFSNKSPLISWQALKQNSYQIYSFWPGTWVQGNEKRVNATEKLQHNWSLSKCMCKEHYIACDHLKVLCFLSFSSIQM